MEVISGRRYSNSRYFIRSSPGLFEKEQGMEEVGGPGGREYGQMRVNIVGDKVRKQGAGGYQFTQDPIRVNFHSE